MAKCVRNSGSTANCRDRSARAVHSVNDPMNDLLRVLVCAAAVAVVGCGSSENSGSPNGSSDIGGENGLGGSAAGGAAAGASGLVAASGGALGASSGGISGSAGVGPSIGGAAVSGGAPSAGGLSAAVGGSSVGGNGTVGGDSAQGGASAMGGSVAAGGTAEVGGASTAGGAAESGGTDAAGGATSGGAYGAGGAVVNPNAGCTELVTDPNVNWRESSLQTDQEIVECLWQTLGRPVGYGESAMGGYDPNGGSKLVVITKSGPPSVEEQLADALSGDDHAWIVFDKKDFADAYEVGMYRLFCSDSSVLGALSGTEAECLDYHLWCQNRGYTNSADCLDQFFNVALNDSNLPIRNPVIGSNKTLDGRMSEAYFVFSGFVIGADSSGEPTQTSSSVIMTHLSFKGAGHVEDHQLDPDMIRSTGASHDIWIHKNDFDLTGDSAFDVKVGAYNITMSFNLVKNVVRATLHGSSDSREINAQITTTMHDNAFVTTDDYYLTLGNTGRRVPLIRRGTSHMWNNVFVNYRKDVLSIRVGAQVLWQDNAFVVNQSLQEKSTVEDSLAELSANLIRDIDGGSYRGEGTKLWFSDGACNIDDSTMTTLTPASGSVPDLSLDYSQQSQDVIAAEEHPAGQELIDYVSATAGKHGAVPFNSPLGLDFDSVLAEGKVPCQ